MNCPCGEPDPADQNYGDVECPLVNGPPELERCPYLSGYMDGRNELKRQLGL